MSRNKLTDDLNFVIKLKKTFETSLSCREVGDKLGISTQTARRYLKDFNLTYPSGRPSKGNLPPKLTGGLIKWIKANPKVKLPSSVAEIVKVTNLTKDQVKSSLYRMKLKHKERIENLGKLYNLPGALKLTSGSIFTFKDIKSYSISHSPFSEDLKIDALLRNKKRVVFKTTLSKLEAYLKLKDS